MRILAIRGRNLASLAEEFEVDFEAEPLGSSPIFAITGPTGAGKSTLLDAICLALFREVPRLRNAPAQGSIGRDSMSPRDPRALMRHGANEAFAEVDFGMPDGQRYRARWSVARARTGTLKADDHAFERLSDGERLGGTRRETEAAILRVIGLNADQFCRAALLAQGDFDAFVKADAGDRAELLERLTGSGIYTELGKAAYLRANEHRQKIAVIGRNIAAQNGLGDAQRANLEDEIAAAASALAKLENSLGSLEEAKRWERRIQELGDLLEKVAHDHRTALEVHAAALPRRTALARDRSAFVFSPQWRALEYARDTHDTLTGKLANFREELSAHDDDVTQAKSRDEQSELALASHRDTTRLLKDEIDQATQLDALLGAAIGKAEIRAAAYSEAITNAKSAEQRLTDAQRAFDEAATEEMTSRNWLRENEDLATIAGRQEELAEIFAQHAIKSSRLAKVVEQSNEAKAALFNAQIEWDCAQAAALEFTNVLSQCVQEREEAERYVPSPVDEEKFAQQREILSHVTQLAERVADARKIASETEMALSETRKRRLKNRADITIKTERYAAIASELPCLIERRDEARRSAERAAAAADDAAVRLRESLVPGEPCAVCGASDHRIDLVSGVLGEHVEEARRHAETLAGEVVDLDREKVALEVSLALLDDQERQFAEDESEQLERNAAAVHTAADLSTELEASAAAAGLDPSSRKFADSLEEAKTALGASLTAAQMSRSRRDDALIAERTARVKAEEAQRAATEAKELVERHNHAHLALEAKSNSLQSSVAQLAKQLDRALVGVCNWEELADGERWLADACRQWRNMTASAETAATQVSNTRVALNDAAIAMRTQHERLEAARKVHDDAQAEVTEKRAERAGLLGGEPVADVNLRLAEIAQRLETARTQARDALSAAERTRSAAKARLAQIEEQVSTEAANIAAQTQSLATQLATANIFEADVARVAAAGSATLDAEADALAQIEQAANSAALLLEQRQADLARHKAIGAPELLGEALSQALDAVRIEFQSADTRHRDLQLQLREDDAVRDRTDVLRKELEAANEEATLWLTLDTLMGDATGKRFRNFAQGLTLDRLLVHANARLADLKPRYSLARGEGGDMVIEVIDNDMAGQVRGLHNLSGGERFLVSLALALGLAEMSTARGMRIESLFIDEGFGALDSDSLGQALALLEHLHAGGRRVGVISHVDELKERIAAKIEVAPTGRGTSEVRVLISG